MDWLYMKKDNNNNNLRRSINQWDHWSVITQQLTVTKKHEDTLAALLQHVLTIIPCYPAIFEGLFQSTLYQALGNITSSESIVATLPNFWKTSQNLSFFVGGGDVHSIAIHCHTRPMCSVDASKEEIISNMQFVKHKQFKNMQARTHT